MTRPRASITTAFASALLLTAPSYAAEKVILSCVGTVTTNGRANERAEGSLVIDLDQGIVSWGPTNLPIVDDRGTIISFANKSEPWGWIGGIIDRGGVFITEYQQFSKEIRNYKFTSCKAMTP
jgi:hypothetical protein